MQTRANLAMLAAAGAVLLASASAPAMAASLTTEAFVANVRPNIDFLDRSSRMALDTAASPAVRTFARTEATEQTIAANSLVAWTQSNTVSGAVAAIGEPVVPSVPGVVYAPVDAAANVTADVTNGVGDLVTGRSVAIDRPLTVTRTPDPANAAVLPAGADDLGRLSTMKGRRFDAFYKTIQRDSLRQLATIYAAYIQNGDDPGLREMAVRELPKINRRLAELRQL